MKVVLDSNVIVSALLSPTGVCARLISLAQDKRYTVAISSSILNEYRRAASYPHVVRLLGSRLEQAHVLIDSLRTVSNMYDPAQLESAISADPKDDMFIACALSARAHYIVSGDKHLLELSQYSGILIICPSEMLRLLESQ